MTARRGVDQLRPARLLDSAPRAAQLLARDPSGRRAPPPSAPCPRIWCVALTFARVPSSRSTVAVLPARTAITSTGSPLRSSMSGSAPAAQQPLRLGDAIVGHGDHEVVGHRLRARRRGSARRARPRRGPHGRDTRAAPQAWRRRSVDMARPRGVDPEEAEEIGGRRVRDRPPTGTPRSCAISAATCGTYAGWLRLPRNGTGARYGESVSISRRSSGTRRATSFTSCAFLNVTMPESEMWKPEVERGPRDVPRFGEAVHDAAGIARAAPPHERKRVGARRRACGSRAACRARSAARMCMRKRSRCQPRSPRSR